MSGSGLVWDDQRHTSDLYKGGKLVGKVAKVARGWEMFVYAYDTEFLGQAKTRPKAKEIVGKHV